MEHLEKALDLTHKLTTSEGSSPGQQDRLGVILTMQGEILNEAKKATTEDRRMGSGETTYGRRNISPSD